MNHQTQNFKQLSPVFLLGIARSGTTLLQSLLDGHPQLLVDVADSHFFQWYRSYYRWLDALLTWPDNLEKRIQGAEAVMISYIFNEASHYYQDFLAGISIPELKRYFREWVRASEAGPKDFIEAYFHALGLASGCLGPQTRYWVDKTLSYPYLFYRYAQWWPKARFIYMVRDPRDVYTSYKKRDIKNKQKTTSIDSFALAWGDSAHALMNCQRLIFPENRYILHYEELVQNPQAVMQSIAQFLEIEYLPCLLNPTKGFGRVAWGGNAESGKKQHGVFQDAANKWRSGLSEREVVQLEGLLSREMDVLGYSASQPVQKSLLLPAKLWARKTIFQFLNLGM